MKPEKWWEKSHFSYFHVCSYSKLSYDLNYLACRSPFFAKGRAATLQAVKEKKNRCKLWVSLKSAKGALGAKRALGLWGLQTFKLSGEATQSLVGFRPSYLEVLVFQDLPTSSKSKLNSSKIILGEEQVQIGQHEYFHSLAFLFPSVRNRNCFSGSKSLVGSITSIKIFIRTTQTSVSE
jgi:hypothetical protein